MSNQEERRARARESLEGLAMGDAYGNHHGNNPRKREAYHWQYSDDTIMASSIVEVLRTQGTIDQDLLAASFAARWDGQRGYGQGATRLLKSIQRGADWREAANAMFDGQGSYGNGAAMRVAPVGAYFADDLDMVIEQAALSAGVTHTHPEGIAGAVAVAVAAALAHRYRDADTQPDPGGFLADVIVHVPPSEVRDKLEIAHSLPPETGIEQAAETLGRGRPVLAQLTVPFTLWAASRYLGDYQETILQTASARGDVDTTCAIVGGIVVMYTGVKAIPGEWMQRREPLPDWPFTNT